MPDVEVDDGVVGVLEPVEGLHDDFGGLLELGELEMGTDDGDLAALVPIGRRCEADVVDRPGGERPELPDAVVPPRHDFEHVLSETWGGASIPLGQGRLEWLRASNERLDVDVAFVGVGVQLQVPEVGCGGRIRLLTNRLEEWQVECLVVDLASDVVHRGIAPSRFDDDPIQQVAQLAVSTVGDVRQAVFEDSHERTDVCAHARLRLQDAMERSIEFRRRIEGRYSVVGERVLQLGDEAGGKPLSSGDIPEVHEQVFLARSSIAACFRLASEQRDDVDEHREGLVLEFPDDRLLHEIGATGPLAHAVSSEAISGDVPSQQRTAEIVEIVPAATVRARVGRRDR